MKQTIQLRGYEIELSGLGEPLLEAHVCHEFRSLDTMAIDCVFWLQQRMHHKLMVAYDDKHSAVIMAENVEKLRMVEKALEKRFQWEFTDWALLLENINSKELIEFIKQEYGWNW